MGIDGATNVLSKTRSNVMIHTPLPIFMEYLRSDLQRETMENVVENLRDVMKRIDDRLKFKYSQAFIWDSCNWMKDVRKGWLKRSWCGGLTGTLHTVLISFARTSRRSWLYR